MKTTLQKPTTPTRSPSRHALASTLNRTSSWLNHADEGCWHTPEWLNHAETQTPLAPRRRR